MRMRRLGRLEVSIVGVGCNNFGARCDEAQTRDVVDAALDCGVNFFDTADIYGRGLSETYLGAALGPRRDGVVIATKFGGGRHADPKRGGSAPWIAQAVEESLRRLGTDRIDLYQMHVPDPDVPIDETLDALDRLVRDGKVLEIGCSNFSGEQIAQAADVSRARGFAGFVSAQNHYSLLHRDPERDVLPACERIGLSLLPYFPLASGMLTGKYRPGEAPPEGARLSSSEDRWKRFYNEENLARVAELTSFAEARGRTILDLAISWLASHSVVASVIAGATRPEQVRANVAAADWELDPAELDAQLQSSAR